MDIFSIFTLCGGLGFFLFGMIVMSSGLEKLAGDKLDKFIKNATSNPIKSLALGAGITIAIQSSSALTVMLVGFVNSGIMELSQTVGMIMGSNVGTTLTSWILSLSGIESSNFFLRLLKPESFCPILSLLGVILIMSGKNNTSKRKNVGMFFVGFAILMFGMILMSSSMSPLAQNSEFAKFLTYFTNPVLGLLTGMIITAIIQSSAASVGILQALALSGGVSWAVAVPIIIGQNIGTCITSMLSAIGVNTAAKRVAVIHVSFNILGALIFLPLYEIGHYFINSIPFNQTISPFGIAVFHSIFNIGTTVLLLPFAKALEKIAYVVINEDKDDKKVILDERLLVVPAVAIEQSFQVTVEMGKLSKDILTMSVKMFKQYNPKFVEIIDKKEKLIDKYQDELESFLQKLSAKDLTEAESNKVSQLFLTISDIEKIADYSVDILHIAQKTDTKNWTFMEDSISELKNVVNAVKEIYDYTMNSFINFDYNEAFKIEPFENIIDEMIDSAKKNHIKRIKNQKIHIRRSFYFVDILTNLERISDHCSNIASNIIHSQSNTIPKHELKNKLKHKTDSAEINLFKEKYFIQKC